MENRDEERRKRLWYIVTGFILVVLIGWLWVRYAANQRLLSQLDSRDMAVRVAAARALLGNGSLADSLPAQPVKRRADAAAALARIATPDAMAQLVVLMKDPENQPQREASRAFSRIGVKAMKPYLWDLLKEADARVKKATTDAFVGIGDPAVPALAKALDDKDRRDTASKAMARIKGPAIPPLLKAAQSKDKGLRGVAIVALGEAKAKEAVPIILPALDVPELQQAAIRALGLIADARATLKVVPFLTDAKLRIDAATALGGIGDNRATSALVAQLGERETQFRTRLVWALQRIGEPTVPQLAAALHSPDVWVRRAAAQALTTARVPLAIPALEAALNDPDIEVRAAAAEGLGWPDNTAGITPLLTAVNDREWQVVDAALASLAQVGRPAIPALEGLFTHGDILKAFYASRALQGIGQPAVPTLIADLSSANEEIRSWAAITLGGIGDKEAVEPLQKMLASPSSSPGERYVAREALRHIGVEVPSES